MSNVYKFPGTDRVPHEDGDEGGKASLASRIGWGIVCEMLAVIAGAVVMVLFFLGWLLHIVGICRAFPRSSCCRRPPRAGTAPRSACYRESRKKPEAGKAGSVCLSSSPYPFKRSQSNRKHTVVPTGNTALPVFPA